MSFSLQTRLLVAVGVLALAAVAAVGVAARQSARYEFRRFKELHDVGRSAIPAATSERVAAALTARCCTPEVVRGAAALLDPHTGFVVVDRATGAAVAVGGAVQALRDLRVATDGDRLTLDALRERGRVSESVRLTFRRTGLPVTLADGRAAHVHVLPFPAPGQEQPDAVFLGSIDRWLVLATSLIGAAVLLVTWGIARRIVGPVAELRDAARGLASGDFSRRVETRGSGEVADLARAFNAMAADLERQQALRRNLVHDVAHELRTPLTALRCRLETIIDGLAPDPSRALHGANEEVGHLAQLVDDLQEVALAEARELRLAIDDVAVASVVESATRAAGLEQDPRLRLDLESGLVARGDAVRVRQVLLNLLANADRHTPAGGGITIAARRDSAHVLVEVRNTGPRLDDEQLARVFDRFYRADPARQRATGGSGLGLAIAKNLVEAQGGRVWARREADGMTFGFALSAVC